MQCFNIETPSQLLPLALVFHLLYCLAARPRRIIAKKATSRAGPPVNAAVKKCKNLNGAFVFSLAADECDAAS